MTTDAVLPIGEQLARARAMAGQSQEELAERSGVSVDVIRKLEQGTRSTARLATLRDLADGLGADLSVLITPRRTLSPVEGQPGGTLEDVRQAVTTAGLEALADLAEPSDRPDLAAVGESATHAWRVWQAGDYSLLAAVLPTLIADARHATRGLRGEDQLAAYGHLATAYEASAGIAIMLGAEDLAWLAAERALGAAGLCGDPVSVASTQHWAAWILRRRGRYAECVTVATRAAERHEPSLMRASASELAVWGGLLVNASGAAARDGNLAQADELLSYARGAAGRLGTDRTDRWTVFGPRLVEQTAVVNATEVGDVELAVRLAANVDAIGGQLPPTWEARYLLGLAAAQVEVGHDGDATSTVARAIEVAPEFARYYRLSRDVVTELLVRAGSRRPPVLEDLAQHLQLAVPSR